MDKPTLYLILYSIMTLFTITGCGSGEACPHITEIQLLKEQLNKCQSNNISGDSNGINHLVYFDVKDNLDSGAIIEFEKLLSSLSELSGVQNLKFGRFKDLGDKRALSSFEYVLSMHFTNEKAYAQYQQDPKHLAIQKAASIYLAGPPSTYDYQ